MPWKRMPAHVTGEIDQSLLLRLEYLQEENRVLRGQIEKRILLTDPERRTLAEKAVALGKLMADTVTIVKPETILKWHRRLVARKFDGSKQRRSRGRPPVIHRHRGPSHPNRTSPEDRARCRRRHAAWRLGLRRGIGVGKRFLGTDR